MPLTLVSLNIEMVQLIDSFSGELAVEERIKHCIRKTVLQYRDENVFINGRLTDISVLYIRFTNRKGVERDEKIEQVWHEQHLHKSSITAVKEQ